MVEWGKGDGEGPRHQPPDLSFPLGLSDPFPEVFLQNEAHQRFQNQGNLCNPASSRMERLFLEAKATSRRAWLPQAEGGTGSAG